MKKTRASRGVYSVHPSVADMMEWVRTLKAKTGRSVEEWVALVRAEGPREEREQREWLKRVHGLGTNSAWWLAARASGSSTGEEDTPEGYLKAAAGYVEEQYAGKRAALRPIYERLLELGLAAGPDAKACPCQTIVPLYRNHVFAQIKATTTARVDLGLALAKVPESRLPRRLIDTGGKAKKDRITHRIGITSKEEIDEFVGRWLRTAYDLDG